MANLKPAGEKALNGSKSAAAGASSRKAPSNSRTIKNSVKTGTVSRSAARSAVKAVSSKRA
jgi:hypothetical protein